MINEGATQEVITLVLDVKGNTFTEPASTRVLNFGFSFTCIDSSNGGGPQAVGELWICVGIATTFRCCVINCIQACLHKVGFLAFQISSLYHLYILMISVQATNSNVNKAKNQAD